MSLLFILTLPFAFAGDISKNLRYIDEYTLTSSLNYSKIPPINEDGTINVIIEVPAGTLAKWEVDDKNANQIIWEFENTNPRIINYLAYPANYGSIPGTFLSPDEGGDNDALDILVLGSAAARGEVLAVRLIGVLRLLDDEEQDDTLIAVMSNSSPFSDVTSIRDLDERFEGVLEIIKLWFTNYKGPDGDVKALGYSSERAAMDLLEQAMEMYKQNNRRGGRNR